MEAPFGHEPGQGFLEANRAVFESERSLAAFDGDRIVATVGVFSFRLHMSRAGKPPPRRSPP